MTRVETKLYTTPDSASGSPRTALLAMIASAKHTIDFGMFAFTSKQIADSLIFAKDYGITVRGVMDATQSVTEKNRYTYLRDAGVDVRIFGGPGRLMHDKVILVDGASPRLARLALGSYNLTGGAEDSNCEVLVIMSGSGVARDFTPVIKSQLVTAYIAGRTTSPMTTSSVFGVVHPLT